MNLLLQHTEYLLSTHDCVVVPGLGAFLALSQSAHYEAGTEEWKSPYRKFAFNESLNVSDGMLIMSIARSNDNNYDYASRIVERDVEEIKSELRRTGEFGFGRIGRLQLSESGQIQFFPYSSDRITPLLHWINDYKYPELNPVTAFVPENSPVTPAPELHTVAPTRNEPRFSLHFNQFVRTALGAAAAILIALIVSTPISMRDIYNASTIPPFTKPTNVSDVRKKDVNDKVAHESNLSLKKQSGASVEKSDSETAQSAPDAKQENGAKAGNDNVQSVNNKETNNTTVTITSPKTSSNKAVATKSTGTFYSRNAQKSRTARFEEEDQYLLIVASLGTREQAERFISENSADGLRFGISDCGTKFRVYAATGATADEAYAQAKNSRLDKFKGSWVALR